MAFSIEVTRYSLDKQKNSTTRIALVFYLYLQSKGSEIVFFGKNKGDIEREVKSIFDAKHYSGIAVADMISQIYYDERDYDWIEDGTRQRMFIEQSIQTMLNTSATYNAIPSLFVITGYLDRDKTIAMIDYYSFELKKFYISPWDLNIQLKELWRSFTKSDSNYSWLRERNSDEVRDFLWDYLNRKHRDIVGFNLKFKNYDEIMVFFDRLGVDQDRKLEILGKAKKLWDQRRSRKEDLESKQYNIRLPISTINSISDLAKKFGLSNAEIVRVVIDAEAKSKYHLTRKSKTTQYMLSRDDCSADEGIQMASKLVANDDLSPSTNIKRDN